MSLFENKNFFVFVSIFVSVSLILSMIPLSSIRCYAYENESAGQNESGKEENEVDQFVDENIKHLDDNWLTAVDNNRSNISLDTSMYFYRDLNGGREGTESDNFATFYSIKPKQGEFPSDGLTFNNIDKKDFKLAHYNGESFQKNNNIDFWNVLSYGLIGVGGMIAGFSLLSMIANGITTFSNYRTYRGNYSSVLDAWENRKKLGPNAEEINSMQARYNEIKKSINEKLVVVNNKNSNTEEAFKEAHDFLTNVSNNPDYQKYIVAQNAYNYAREFASQGQDIKSNYKLILMTMCKYNEDDWNKFTTWESVKKEVITNYAEQLQREGTEINGKKVTYYFSNNTKVEIPKEKFDECEMLWTGRFREDDGIGTEALKAFTRMNNDITLCIKQKDAIADNNIKRLRVVNSDSDFTESETGLKGKLDLKYLQAFAATDKSKLQSLKEEWRHCLNKFKIGVKSIAKQFLIGAVLVVAGFIMKAIHSYDELQVQGFNKLSYERNTSGNYSIKCDKKKCEQKDWGIALEFIFTDGNGRPQSKNVGIDTLGEQSIDINIPSDWKLIEICIRCEENVTCDEIKKEMVKPIIDSYNSYVMSCLQTGDHDEYENLNGFESAIDNNISQQTNIALDKISYYQNLYNVNLDSSLVDQRSYMKEKFENTLNMKNTSICLINNIYDSNFTKYTALDVSPIEDCYKEVVSTSCDQKQIDYDDTKNNYIKDRASTCMSLIVAGINSGIIKYTADSINGTINDMDSLKSENDSTNNLDLIMYCQEILNGYKKLSDEEKIFVDINHVYDVLKETLESMISQCQDWIINEKFNSEKSYCLDNLTDTLDEAYFSDGITTEHIDNIVSCFNELYAE